jgi:hypothetical protein
MYKSGPPTIVVMGSINTMEKKLKKYIFLKHQNKYKEDFMKTKQGIADKMCINFIFFIIFAQVVPLPIDKLQKF